MPSYFKNPDALKELLGIKAFKKLQALIDPCCGATGGNGTLVSPDPEDFSFTPNSRKTFLKYNGPLTGNISLDVDVSQSFLGDELIIMAQAVGNDWDINLDSDFFYTQCGGDVMAIEVPDGGRVVMIFTFDGEKFCSTTDNC